MRGPISGQAVLRFRRNHGGVRGIRNTCVSEEPAPDAGVDASVPGDGGLPECMTPSDCDDGLYCNGVEDCVGGECIAAPMPVACDDGIACTIDACDEETDACEFLPQHDSCTDPLLAFCDRQDGCRDQPCTLAADCDDGLHCNGMETCSIPTGETLGSCGAGSAPTCDDGVSCTGNVCSVGMNMCVNSPNDISCDNGVFCDGQEICSGSSGCGAGAAPNCPISCNEIAKRCNDCVPNLTSCSAGISKVCGPDGLVASSEQCILGCHAGGLRCLDVDPSNGLASYLDMTSTAPSIVLTSGSTINPTNGEVRDHNNAVVAVPSVLIPAPAGGVPVRVLIVGTITLGDVEVLSSSSGLAIVADGEVLIMGKLDLGAETSSRGPGAVQSVSGMVGSSYLTSYSGGGGGGFGTIGAAGGIVTGLAGGAYGTAAGNAQLVPLRGGAPGGCLTNVPGGGGAIQVVSRSRIRLTGSGEIDLSGGGGTAWSQHELDPNGTPGGGCGGGSGGGALLEAPEIRIEAGTGIHANGGGGGCAFTYGSDGQFSTSGAAGASCAGSNRGNGGVGGARNTAAGAGASGVSPGTPLSGGGGGGAVGRIRLNALVVDAAPGSIVSPAPSQGGLGGR